MLGFLVEYSHSRTFADSFGSTVNGSSSTLSETIDASAAIACGGRPSGVSLAPCFVEFAHGRPELFDPADCQFQITGLHEEPYHVRVSAYNALGFSQSAVTWPAVATPSDMVLYKPTNVSVTASPGGYPNRVRLGWALPTVDALGFDTSISRGLSPSVAEYYRVQWATDKAFGHVDGTYDLSTLRGEGERFLCEEACQIDLGVEVQAIKIYSTGMEPLTGGSFKVVYLGPSSPFINVLPAHGSDRVRIALDNSAMHAPPLFPMGTLCALGGAFMRFWAFPPAIFDSVCLTRRQKEGMEGPPPPPPPII